MLSISSGDTDHKQAAEDHQQEAGEGGRRGRGHHHQPPEPAQQPAGRGDPGADADGAGAQLEWLVGAGWREAGHQTPVTASESQAPTDATAE